MTTTTPTDTDRLKAAADFVREQDGATLLPLLFPTLDAPTTRALVERCRFAHAALLVFPPDMCALRRDLADCGLDADVPSRPSVVVRQRLAARYGRAADDLDMRILRPRVRGADGGRRLVEVLALVVPEDSEIARAERAEQHEAHVALEVENPDPLVLDGLRTVLTRHGARADGGGYNPHEDGTVFYFRTPSESKSGYRRVELYARGDHSDVLAAHLDDHLLWQPAEKLLRLLTGAWTTQALRACAELRIPEAMDQAVVTGVEALAVAVGAEPRSLATLLRHLAVLDVVK